MIDDTEEARSHYSKIACLSFSPRFALLLFRFLHKKDTSFFDEKHRRQKIHQTQPTKHIF